MYESVCMYGRIEPPMWWYSNAHNVVGLPDKYGNGRACVWYCLITARMLVLVHQYMTAYEMTWNVTMVVQKVTIKYRLKRNAVLKKS